MKTKSTLLGLTLILVVIASVSGFGQVNVKTGGIKIIPIQTPEGTFNAWTRPLVQTRKSRFYY